LNHEAKGQIRLISALLFIKNMAAIGTHGKLDTVYILSPQNMHVRLKPGTHVYTGSVYRGLKCD